MGDTFELDQGDRETPRGTLHDPQATAGDVLTVQADKSIAAAPGGGSTPVLGFYAGGDVDNVSGSAPAFPLPIVSLDAGEPLLDITNPLASTFVDGGFYAVSFNGFVSPVLVAGDDASMGMNNQFASPSAPLAPTQSESGTMVTYVGRWEAGDPLAPYADLDAVSPTVYHFFLSSVTVVKLA